MLDPHFAFTSYQMMQVKVLFVNNAHKADVLLL